MGAWVAHALAGCTLCPRGGRGTNRLAHNVLTMREPVNQSGGRFPRTSKQCRHSSCCR